MSRWPAAALTAALAAVAAPVAAQQRDTTPPPGAVESAFSFSSGSVTLAGILTRPSDSADTARAAVIVTRGGPSELVGLAERARLDARLAWQLAERGIASLRYDQRDQPATRGELDRARVSFDEYALDVKSAAVALRDTRFTQVVAVGHGEGAALVLRAANAGAPVAGIALLAGLGQPLLDARRERLAHELDAAALLAYDTAMALYLAGETPDHPATLAHLFQPANRYFLESAVTFDPLAEIARVPVRVLLVHGRRDGEVSERDAELLAQARPDARLVILPHANHLFTRETLARAPYEDPSAPLVPELVDVLVEWVRALP